MTAERPQRLVIVRDDCLHPETLRGQVGVLVKHYDDGTVLVRFDKGQHAGDRVCMPRSCVELLS